MADPFPDESLPSAKTADPTTARERELACWRARASKPPHAYEVLNQSVSMGIKPPPTEDDEQVKELGRCRGPRKSHEELIAELQARVRKAAEAKPLKRDGLSLER